MSRRFWRFLAGALALALLLAGAARIADRLFEQEGGAKWIWAEGNYKASRPLAFYAARDVELRAAVPGRIGIVADESYRLYLNGRRLGAGSYRAGAALDVYDVGGYLEAGINRIVVELASSRGAGGFLARLELTGSDPIVTDGSWRIFRRHDDGLLRGWSHLAGGEAPKVWGPAPTGRWRLAGGAGGRLRPIPFQTFPPAERVRPPRHRLFRTDAWRELGSRRRIPVLGPQQVFDWGREVTGYLSFDLRSGDGLPGLLYVGSQPPDPSRRPPDAVIMPIPGRHFWQDARARRFRYALLVGVEPRRRVEVDLLDGEPAGVAAELSAPPEDPRGVFGVKPPRSYSTVDQAVWSRLERADAERARKRS